VPEPVELQRLHRHRFEDGRVEILQHCKPRAEPQREHARQRRAAARLEHRRVFDLELTTSHHFIHDLQ
jgi:hypothetical protein